MRTLFLLILSLATGLLLAACGGAESGNAARPQPQLQRVAQVAPGAAAAAVGPEGAEAPRPAAEQPAGHEGHAAGASHGAGHAGAEHRALAAGEPLPGRSLYHLTDTWRDHRGEEVTLADLRGRPVVVVMFYASCDTACPILVRDALRLEESLPAELREETTFLMVTIDPERDAPERLARYVEQNGLERPNWTFLTGASGQTRALAALLGVQYREAGNGTFSHTNLLTVLDREGQTVLRTEGLGQPVGPAVEAIAALR